MANVTNQSNNHFSQNEQPSQLLSLEDSNSTEPQENFTSPSENPRSIPSSLVTTTNIDSTKQYSQFYKQQQQQQQQHHQSNKQLSPGMESSSPQSGTSSKTLGGSTITATSLNSLTDHVKNIYIHRNGDQFSSAKKIVWNRKQLRNWDVFVEHLTNVLKPDKGAIRDVFTPHTGTRVLSFEDLKAHHNYVAVPVGENLRLIDYESITAEQDAAAKRRYPPSQKNSMQDSLPEPERVSTPPPAPPIRPVLHSRIIVSGRIKHELQKRGKLIHVYKNTDEFTRAIAIVLKPIEQTSMELVMMAIEEKVVLPLNRPIRHLYNMDGQEVLDPNDLQENNFYVAASSEAFSHRQYGQVLPRVTAGKFNRWEYESVKYLNSSVELPQKRYKYYKDDQQQQQQQTRQIQSLSDQSPPPRRNNGFLTDRGEYRLVKKYNDGSQTERSPAVRSKERDPFTSQVEKRHSPPYLNVPSENNKEKLQEVNEMDDEPLPSNNTVYDRAQDYENVDVEVVVENEEGRVDEDFNFKIKRNSLE